MSTAPRVRWLLTATTTATFLSLITVSGRGQSIGSSNPPDGPLQLTRLPASVVIDGMPDESAWQQIPVLPLTLYTPVFRGQPTQRSEIRVAYDDQYFYAAGWFYDTDPDGIRINSLYRDRWNGDDAFAIYIDPFNDNKNAKWFGTTPGGIRFDILLSDDGNTQNDSWDTFWDAKTRVTAEGWFAEVRIPFSSIGFRADGGQAVMGLTVTRLVSRLNERVTFPAIDPRLQFRQPSVAQDVVLTDVRSSRPLYITPYALTGVEQRQRLTAKATDYALDRDRSREVGVDLRYALTSRLTLDVTTNTDFAQVEADDQQVNLDRFSLFFPEKRRFFQEGSGVFDFTMASGTRLFHSRRIGLTDDGSPVPVLGGVRLVGRAGAWDVGLLGMRTEDLDEVQGETFGAMRFRRGILNPYSTAGFLLTSRSDGVEDNYALGADAVVRVRGDEYLTLKWAGTTSGEDRFGGAFARHSQLHAQYERRVGRGLQYSVTYSRAGADFQPELGFLQRSDFTTANAFGNWFIFTDSHKTLRRVYPGALAFSTWRNSDGKLESAQYAVWVQWDTKAGGGGWIEPKVFHEDVLTAFPIGRTATIPAGSYTFADLQLVLQMPQGRRLRTTMDARAGTYFDGTRAQVILSPTWNLSRHLELGGTYQVSVLRFDDRDEKANIHLARLRIGATLDARASANAFVQYNSTTQRVNVNLRARYNFAEGTDLWVVYDEGLTTDRLPEPGEPRLPRSMSRSLMVKYTHTFRM
ncbi:MAG TPA: DUF5916 domain-containing protein [Gemmatimonadaceae bacterium]|nr:DUF5916 domain-containing protein [Gemmatimonadaceae bacterium]